MKKIARVALIGAVLGGNLFVAAGPASATCRPEKPSTCEADLPSVQEIIDNCYSSIDPGLPRTGICNL